MTDESGIHLFIPHISRIPRLGGRAPCIARANPDKGSRRQKGFNAMGAYFNEKQKCYFPTVVSFFETTISINIQNPIEQPHNF
jgi:hypothetical protein